MNQFKEHHIYIPAIAIMVLIISSWLSASGMDWYATLALPSYTPPMWAFPLIWNSIYFLTIIAAIKFWDTVRAHEGYEVKWLFAANACINVAWTFCFFFLHAIGTSLALAVLLECNILLLMLLIWPVSRVSALLLTPYLLWVVCAILLNYALWQLN